MLIDHYSDFLDGARSLLTVAAAPIVVVADLPEQTARGLAENVRSREDMAKELSQMRQEMLLLRAKTEKMAALTAENNRLRDLLGSAAKLQDNVLVAELIGVDPDPERHEVIIDKGSRDGVFAGQPLLDAEGLMGQVVEVGPFTSRVLLISDHSHSIPVQLNRSNLRLIAQGTGVINQLQLNFVQITADIQEGDLLVSSGLGGRFPTGYPVGVVSEVSYDPGQPFVTVRATTSALLDRSRHVLLVFTDDQIARAPQVNEGGQDG